MPTVHNDHLSAAYRHVYTYIYTYVYDIVGIFDIGKCSQIRMAVCNDPD